MAYHVTIDPLREDGLAIESYLEAMMTLKPESISVDMAGPLGRVLLAALQARGLPATALEKRPRPALGEVQRIEELSKDVDRLQQEAQSRELELRHLRAYQRDIRVLIERLDH